MKHTVMVLAALAVSLSMGGPPGWVVSCQVVDDEVSASGDLALLDSLGYDAGVIRISEWVSLDGQDGWMVYAGPLASEEDASWTAAELLWMFPNAHGTIVHQGESNCIAAASPQGFIELNGLVPPVQDFGYSIALPASWSVSLEAVGPETLPERERPVRIVENLPGWRVEAWQDISFGTMELRAVRTGDPMNLRLFRSNCDYLREVAPGLGAEVIEGPGEYILLHMLPTPTDTFGDLDFWAVLSGDSIEYGYRCRSFSGGMPYSWNGIPAGARGSLLPVEFDSDEGAIDHLYRRLLRDGVYGEGSMEDFSYGIEYMDGWDEGVYRDYRDVALREVHHAGGSGDPSTSPIVDRFRVYDRTGEILWWHPLHGELVPYGELAGFRGD